MMSVHVSLLRPECMAELEYMLTQRSEKDPGANQPEAYIESGGR